MLTVAPPTKPRAGSTTTYGGRSYYTLHTEVNNAFALRPKDCKTSIVGFKNVNEAVLVGCMIETHFSQYNEWPEIGEDGIILPSPKSISIEDLSRIFIKKWNFDNLKLLCTRNVLDLISVEDISRRRGGFTFSGSMYTFNADIGFYQERFNELLDN